MNKFLILILNISISFVALAQTSRPINFHEIEVGVYRGARPDESNIAYLTSLQPQANSRSLTVIDLEGGDPLFLQAFETGEYSEWIENENQWALQAGLDFEWQPLNSANTVNQDEVKKIDHVLSLMKRAFKDASHYQVYIHCEYGVDRTGLVAALFRVEVEGWSPQKAYQEWQSYGHTGIADWLITHDLDYYFFQRTQWVPQSL
jgi:protein tyrosine/serine phosphatase